MPWGRIEVLEALRLPELYRKVCGYAGVPTGPGPATDDCFVIRSGPTSPRLAALLLEEAFIEDEAEVEAFEEADDVDLAALSPGQIIVRGGYESPCPVAAALRQAAGARSVLVFAIERRGPQGRLLGVTWAAVPEDEPSQEAPLRAAVVRGEETV